MKNYKGTINTKFWWIIPILIGISKNNVDNKAIVYTLHITPFFEIGFNWKKINNKMDTWNVIQVKRNERGFENGKFKDSYNNECSIQKSSLAMNDFIWLGIDKPKLTVFKDENMGEYLETILPKNWMVNSRMHLSRKQVAELLPILQKFVDTGELS